MQHRLLLHMLNALRQSTGSQNLLTPHAHAAALVRHQLLYRQQHQPEAHNATMFKGHKLTHDTRSLDFAHWMLQLFELVA